jgi:thioesterase domain-containing protein
MGARGEPQTILDPAGTEAVLPAELERYLHERIPLTRAMAVSVLSVDENAVVLQAPLAPNTNQRDTVFGGSASALAILAAWSLLHVRLRAEGIDNRLVIQRNTMDYERPITGAFTARSRFEDPERWRRFTQMLARKGKARVTVPAVLEQAGAVVARLSGEFVAIRPPRG